MMMIQSQFPVNPTKHYSDVLHNYMVSASMVVIQEMKDLQMEKKEMQSQHDTYNKCTSFVGGEQKLVSMQNQFV